MKLKNMIAYEKFYRKITGTYLFLMKKNWQKKTWPRDLILKFLLEEK